MSTNINTFKHTPHKIKPTAKLKPIEIEKYLNYDGLVANDGEVHVKDWSNAVLICKKTNNGEYDTFMLYDDCMVNGDGTVNCGVTCFGKWNDGVVSIPIIRNPN